MQVRKEFTLDSKSIKYDIIIDQESMKKLELVCKYFAKSKDEDPFLCIFDDNNNNPIVTIRCRKTGKSWIFPLEKGRKYDQKEWWKSEKNLYAALLEVCQNMKYTPNTQAIIGRLAKKIQMCCPNEMTVYLSKNAGDNFSNITTSVSTASSVKQFVTQQSVQKKVYTFENKERNKEMGTDLHLHNKSINELINNIGELGEKLGASIRESEKKEFAKKKEIAKKSDPFESTKSKRKYDCDSYYTDDATIKRSPARTMMMTAAITFIICLPICLWAWNKYQVQIKEFFKPASPVVEKAIEKVFDRPAEVNGTQEIEGL